METLANRALRITEGVPEAIGRDRFLNHSWRISFILPCGCGEFVETLSALEYLERSEAILSLPFS